MIVGLHALVCLFGLVVYSVSTNGKSMEIGRIMFFCGLLALLLGAERVVALFK